MKRPDKYPTIDTRLPDLYGRILKAAQSLRSVRLAEDSGARAAHRDREIAARLALIQKEADEPVVWLSKNGGYESASALTNSAEPTATA